MISLNLKTPTIHNLPSALCRLHNRTEFIIYFIAEPATFKDSPSTKRAVINDIVRLSCSYYNSSIVNFQWIKDYEVLDISRYNRTAKSVKDTQNVFTTTHDLVFRISTIAQQGRYWCRLKEGNSLQKDSGKATVILKGKFL